MSQKFNVECEVVNRDPDIVCFRNLLSKAECDHLIKIAEPHLERSKTFSGNDDPRRTSSSAFSSKFKDDPVVHSINYRCSVLSAYPISHVEPTQVVRYLPGERYIDHRDNYNPDQLSYKISGQRDYTFFIYLNEPACDDQTGGQTFFSQLGIGVRPERGMAVFWRNIKIPDGSDEDRDKILHQGIAPVGWTKYGMNVWLRRKPWKG